MKQHNRNMKNNFKVLDSNGVEVEFGYNVVLKSGRKFNGMVASGIPTQFSADENTSGAPILVDPRSCATAPLTIAGFGLIGGVLASSVPNPNTAYQTDYLPVSSANKADFIVIEAGHSWSGRIKKHTLFDGTNPYSEDDANGVSTFIHTLRTEKTEIADKYFNAVVLFASVVQGGVETFIPYSMFSLAPLENENEEYSHELKYSVYL